MAALKEFIEKSKLFALLDEEGRDRLAKIAVEVTFPTGAVVMEEGEEGESFYATLSGALEVAASDFADSPKRVATLEAGSVFGEIAALTGEPRTATVTAVEETCCLKFEIVSVFSVLKDYPKVLANLKRLGVARSEDLLNKMMDDA